VRNRYPLAVTALLAAVLILYRAATQSITIDEATTYQFFVARDFSNLWKPAANNHLLNSLLMKLSTQLFGVSAFTARIPALLGAAFYLAAAARLSILIAAGRRSVEALLFAGLVFNPFILDYLIAARGYSMALGFLLSAIAISASAALDPDPNRRVYTRAAICSALLGLCFVANFSFAIAAATTLAACFALDRQRTPRLALVYLVPGLLIAAALSAKTLVAWTPNQFTYGARTLAQSAQTLIEASFYQPDLNLFGKTSNLGYILIALVAAASAFRIISLRIDRKPNPQLRIAATLFASLAACILLHWIAHRTFGLLLPRDRTAGFVVPIVSRRS